MFNRKVEAPKVEAPRVQRKHRFTVNSIAALRILWSRAIAIDPFPNSSWGSQNLQRPGVRDDASNSSVSDASKIPRGWNTSNIMVGAEHARFVSVHGVGLKRYRSLQKI